MLTFTGVTNLKKYSPVFWPTLYMRHKGREENSRKDIIYYIPCNGYEQLQYSNRLTAAYTKYFKALKRALNIRLHAAILLRLNN